MLHLRAERHDHDVVIAGAGPAGAALAVRLGRAGWRVALVDPGAFPRDKVCGDFLGPGGIAELEALGLTAPEPFRRSNRVGRASLFLDGAELISRDIPVVADLPDHGRVIPRLVLDDLIYRAALQAGAVHVRDRLSGFTQEAGGIRVALKGGGSLRARLLVGADGSASTVGRLFQPQRNGRQHRIVAVRAYYEGVTGDEDRCDLFFSSASFPGYYWLFPTGGGGANVGVGMVLETLPPAEAKLSTLLESLIETDPALRARLAGARIEGRILGWPLSTYDPARRAVGDRIMLLGDAAGLINPLNGEGIQYAVESARWAAGVVADRLAADRLSAADLAPYERTLRARMNYDIALAGLIIQVIRNRGLNPVWLKALEIITQRARRDPAYAEIAGGVLAGLTPARSVIGKTMILGSLRQALMTLGAETAIGAARHKAGPRGFTGDLWQMARDMAAENARHPGAAAVWACGSGCNLAASPGMWRAIWGERFCGAALKSRRRCPHRRPRGSWLISAVRAGYNLEVTLDHEDHEVAQEVPVLAWRKPAVNAVELGQSGACKEARHLPGMGDGAEALHVLQDFGCLGLAAPLPGPRQVAQQRLLPAGRHAAQKMQQRQGALALQHVAADLLAVFRKLAHKVQKIVLNLEGEAEEVAEIVQRVRRHLPACAEKGADADRVHGRVPAGLLQAHAEIVRILQRGGIVPHPAQLDRLAFDGFADHVLDLGHDEPCEARADLGQVFQKRAHGQHEHCVPRVQRQGDAVGSVQRRLAPAKVAFILDVVMDEKAVMEHLDCHGRADGQPGGPAKGRAGRHAERGAQPLAAPAGIIAHQIVELTGRLAPRQVLHDGGIGLGLVDGEAAAHPVGALLLGHSAAGPFSTETLRTARTCSSLLATSMPE